MRTKTDGVVFTTLKCKGIIIKDGNGHTMIDITKFLEISDDEFLRCRNVGEYTVGEIEKLKYKLKTLVYGKSEK